MFDFIFAKGKNTDRVFEIFKILLLRYHRNHVFDISNDDLMEMYKSAIRISDSVNDMEEIYLLNGDIDLT